MGKKGKVGKARRDKFYHLAKETGYRSRASFKLLQLNRKYDFLPKARVCVDLCAAPGSWLQVAAHHMPMSSHIIGVDLVPIKPIHNVTTFQADITTDKCRQLIRKDLRNWEVDIFLNDGAPNVGKNWLHDAYQQAELTLAALKLATEFLRQGGWFITKVFRSKDYQALLANFGELFKKVFATKPKASRNESAEIFVVCQGFLKPKKIDPKLLDPKYVFRDTDEEKKKTMNLFKAVKDKKRPLGYEEGDYLQHTKLLLTDFLQAENHLELLAEAHEIVLNYDAVVDNKLTTPEIKSCCQDIKVLGKKDIRGLLNWRKKINDFLEKQKPKDEVEEVEEKEADSEDEEEELNQCIVSMKEDIAKSEKKKKKKERLVKRKAQERLDKGIDIKGDHLEMTDDIDLFDLGKIHTKKGLKAVESDSEVDEAASSEEENADEITPWKETRSYSRHDEDVNGGDEDNDEDDSDEDDSDEDDSDDDDITMEQVGGSENPLIVDFETKDAKKQGKTDRWFSKDIFKDVEDEADEDMEVDQLTRNYKRKGGAITETNSSSEEEEEDSDDESEEDDENEQKENGKPLPIKEEKKAAKRSAAEPFNKKPQKVIRLDAAELAMGEKLIASSKSRRDVVDDSFNRYTFNDDDLPDWFAKEEAKHMRKPLPVTKERVQLYKDRQRAIDARPIKKIAEARARKKKKGVKRLEKVRKKAEGITDTEDVSEQEKWSQIKQIYRRAGLLQKKKQETTYVVAKKTSGKKVSRPAGVKGHYKVVDPRMKKDLKHEKAAAKKGGKSKGGKRGKGRR